MIDIATSNNQMNNNEEEEEKDEEEEQLDYNNNHLKHVYNEILFLLNSYFFLPHFFHRFFQFLLVI